MTLLYSLFVEDEPRLKVAAETVGIDFDVWRNQLQSILIASHYDDFHS